MAVFENFPYTNVHELNLNWLIKNMTQLLEDWDAFTTNVDATAVSGSSAGVEVIGSLKEGLTFKFTLPKGDKGDIGNTGNGIDTVLFNPNYSLTFNFTNGTSYTTPSLRGAQGEGLEIKDTYPTLQDLKQAHPTGVEGDAYLIGTDPNFVLYIWSTRLNDYAMVGALTSPQPTETTPLMDGVASAGDEYTYARGDHRHPSDTSKVDVTTYNQAIQGKQDLLTAGTGIDITNNVITNVFETYSGDLNNLTYNFQGYCSGITNSPTGANGQCCVIVDKNSTLYCLQIFSPYSENNLYIRNCNNGAWSSWRRLSSYYMPGDTYVSTKVQLCAGYFASGGKELRFSIPFSSPLMATAVNFSNLIISVFNHTGQMYNAVDVATTSDYSIATSVGENEIYVKVTVPTAQTANISNTVLITSINATFA